MKYNELGLEENRRLKGPYGKQLLRTMHRSTAVLQWRNLYSDEPPSHGSMFFVNTGSALLAITARHVYEAYVASAANDPKVTCQINNIRFDPGERLICSGVDCDVATFALRPAELTELERITIPWPPVIPKVGQTVLIAGFPGFARTCPAPQHVDFFNYLAITPVDSVSDRDISWAKPPSEELVDILEKGLPPDGLDLAGMSGGPVAILQENAGIVSWAISGIIYESHQTLEITKAVRADVVKPDGTVGC
jgi:hypothetical protein